MVRIAMLMTTIMIASVMLTINRQGDLGLSFDEFDQGVKMAFNVAFLGFITMVGLVVMFARKKLEEPLEDAKKGMFVIMAWAAAEGVAMFGAVLIAFGVTSFFVAGMMTFGMALLAVPVPESSEEN